MFVDEKTRINRTKIIDHLHGLIVDELNFARVIDLCKSGMSNIVKTSILLKGKVKVKGVYSEVGSAGMLGGKKNTLKVGRLYKGLGVVSIKNVSKR